jgi:hypothetical protein
MDYPLIGRPILDDMDFVASQHLDPVRDKFHLHDFSHIGVLCCTQGETSVVIIR